ncbi:hypothetical protein JTE90_001958 [Oedothorax gibbosus]|uniref:THAP-type domain-containing protein n=1 Tax=Oedothorax gibbosus TaxID=931172 RepID=A0AAV6VVJ6_9ARAC|nr:hypothetical protein JTE90_001958 [Oedothorax gibbosus]
MSEELNFSNLNLSCCVTLCKNYQNILSNIELYPLPDDSTLRKLFSDTLGIPLEVALHRNARVCALHFVSKNPEVRKNIETASPSILKLAVPTMPNFSYSSPAPIVLGNQPTYVNLPFNSNFGPPIRFFLQKPVLNTSSVPNQGIKFLSPSNNYSAKGTSILKRSILLGSTSGAKDIVNIPQETITVPPDESSNNSVESIEEGIESELDLQCDEEQLSQAQLNAYYANLVNFISANERIARIPVPAKMETISVQTDPVTILSSDPIPLQEPCITITESCGLQSLEEEEEISIINQVSGLSGTASASHKITQIIDRNTSLLNSVQVPPRQNDGVGTSSAMSASDLNKSSVSTLTIPSSTLSTAYTYGDKSTLPANSPKIVYQVRPPPVYIPSEKITEAAPLINQVYSKTSLDTNLLNVGQQGVSAAMQLKTYQKKQTSLPERQKATLQVFSMPSNQIRGALPPYNLNAINQPFQYVIQNKDQPIVLRSSPLSASGSTVLGLNSAPSTSATNDNDNDKEADLLNLCNVATVYGNDSPSQTSTDSDLTFDLNPVNGVLDKLKKITNSSSGNSSVIGAHKEIQPPSGTFLDSSGPLIVDVISAAEGAKEYFIGDKIPNILFSRNSQNSSNGKEMYTANLPLNNSYQAGTTNANVPLREKDIARSSSTDKSRTADGLPPTIKLNNSVFSFQKSIPILSTGLLWVGKPHLFLTYLNLPVLRSRSAEAEVLRGRLQTEKYIPCSAWWMVRRNYLPTISPCQCKCHAFTIHRSLLFPNGFYWQCENPNCLRKESVRKPKFFEEYKNWTIEELLLMTFHWACQTPFAEVMEEVKLSPDCILTYYTALRNLCRQVSMKKCKLGTSPYDYVECSLVKMGSYFVLGAYDRNTNYIRLEVLEESQAYNSTLHIELLKTWLTEKAVLVTEQKLSEEILKGIQKMQAKPDVYNITSKEPHILNISNFLLTNLTAIFGKVNVDSMSLDQLKGLLYELQWRAKYGKFLDMAFWSILNDIRDLNDSKKGQITVKPGNLDVEGYCEKMPPILRNHWGFFGPVKERTNVPKKVPFKKKFSPNKTVVPQTMNPLQPPTTLGIKYPAIQPKKTTQPEPSKKRTFLFNINNSCSNLFKDVPVIPGGNSNINSKSLLAIKIRCEDSSPSGVYKPNATSLGLQLRTEGFISNPVKWLVKRGYLSGHNPCYVCKQTAVLKSNDKFKDGCSWSCQNEKCKFENMFKRPLFFARFNEQPMAQIAAMIFHWTVQSDYNIVVSDVPLEPVKISHAWRAFQVLCSSALKRENFKVGGEGQVVEVALVQFGKLYILGARHRITKRTLLKCFPTERIDQVYLVYQTLRNWIIPGSHVAVNSTALFRLDKSVVAFKADTTITDKSSTQMHVLNITSYLMKHVFDMFGHLRASTVKAHLMQVYLDELMWRERFGKLPNLAFAKIMYEIFYHEKHSNSFLQNHHFNFSVKELIEEEPQLHAFKKEVCVVLHRIPQTVLKYYNCWPIPKVQKNEVASKPIEISNSDDDSISRILSEEDFQFSNSNDSVSRNEKKKFTKRSKGKSVHRQALDESSSSSSSSSSEEEDSCFSGDGGNTSPESVSDESSDVDNLLPYTGKRRKVAMQDRTAKVIKKDPESPEPKPMNSVRKLVIKMNKNSQKCQSYFKSDTVKAKYKRQRSRGLFNVRRSRKKSQNKSRSKTNLSQNKLKPDVVVKQEILDDEPGPSGYCPPAESEIVGAISARRRTFFASKQICIECGKEIKFEHFMKRYDCTDCTKTKYSTCCRNAFFEHRSALLFGKRPPRREKVKLNYGLHRPRPLSYTVACPCGFKTKVGNEMASHMVRCQHSSCNSQS